MKKKSLKRLEKTKRGEIIGQMLKKRRKKKLKEDEEGKGKGTTGITIREKRNEGWRKRTKKKTLLMRVRKHPCPGPDPSRECQLVSGWIIADATGKKKKGYVEIEWSVMTLSK